MNWSATFNQPGNMPKIVSEHNEVDFATRREFRYQYSKLKDFEVTRTWDRIPVAGFPVLVEAVAAYARAMTDAANKKPSWG